MNQLTSLVNRILFVVAFALAALAFWEKVLNLGGYTTGLPARGYEPSRLLELSAVALLFVVALLLREIREALASKRGAA